MKRWSILALILSGLAASMAALAAPAPSGPREAQWRRVQQAMDQGLPRSALEALKPILDGAARDRNWAELGRAIGRRIKLETSIEGDRPEEAIVRLRAAIETAPKEIQPILHSVLADAWWSYFRQNRWRYLQRTAVADTDTDADGGVGPEADFRTWDLRRILTEIDRQFARALADDATLKATPIAQFDALLDRGAVPDSLRPTLYDFLVHEALEFYQSGELDLVRPEDAFAPGADSPLFDPVEAFLAWNPETSDERSPVLKAIRLYQALLGFHRSDADPGALLAADIDRLEYARKAAAGADQAKDARYLAALDALAERWPTQEASARARYLRAERLNELDRRPEAHRVAHQVARDFPQSPWAAMARNLVRTIEAPELRLATERVWNVPWPDIEIDYRNVKTVWFRAIAADWDQFLDRRRPRPENLNRAQRLEFLRRPPAWQWSVDLPSTPDFEERRHRVPPPEFLAPGFYLLFASARADFGEEDNQVSVTEIWVSDLALIVRTREGQFEGLVLDARTGEPVPEATVEAWYLANNGERVALEPRTTDSLGFYRFAKGRTGRGHLVRARLGQRQVTMADDLWWPPSPEPEGRWQQTLFFTDRAIYRPGQLIQYKGLTLRGDPSQDRFEPDSGRQVTVVFRDVNQAEIARQVHRANAFGSFAGSFTAPRDRLLGRMSIGTDEPSHGAAWVQVEEYKRPKFQVTLDAPTLGARLGDRIRIGGRALAFTGAAVDRAQVTWRVTRQVRFPPWWGWFRSTIWPPHRQSSQAIAHGTAVTATDGSLQIDFPAVPDPEIPEDDEPSFEFVVHVDVTDNAGETRSADRVVRVGYTALSAAIDADDWQERDRPVSLRVTTKSLDDEPQAATGTLRIHRLVVPASVQRPSLIDWHSGPRRGRGPAVEPSPEAPDPSDPNRWELGPSIAEQPFQTSTNGIVTNRFELAPGFYRAVLETRDRFGKKVIARHPLRVLDPEAPTLGQPVPHLVAAPAWTIEPGREFSALWGTGYESGRAFIEVEHRGEMIQRFWTQPGRTQQRITQAVTDAMRGGFTLHVTQVRDNRAYFGVHEVEVPWTNKELDLSWESFRSKLEPGQKETWTLTVRPRLGTAESAEFVAALYDASLDLFAPHDWLHRFGFWPDHSSSARSTFANFGRRLQEFYGAWKRDSENVDIRHRSFPDDLRFEERFRMTPMMMSRGAAAWARTGIAPGALADAPMAMAAEKGVAMADAGTVSAAGIGGGEPGPSPAAAAPNLSLVTARKNLAETAFFLPQITTDSNGTARLVFTLPESLGEWRFLGFAHDRQLRSGFLEGRTVTVRDIMVQPNPPRFLREGDVLEFTVKVSNQSEQRQTGRVRLELTYARDGAPADAELGNGRPELDFDLPAKESRAYSWRLRVPDGCGFLAYRAVASTGKQSDGEEGYLPVLSRRIFLTESLPLSVRGPATHQVHFESLAAGLKSPTLRPESVTVQMASQPAWYAVLALPYLMEFPHECAEQVFNRLYANALARHIAHSDPRIRRVFDQWRGTPALDSPLVKNEDLKAVLIAETPWLRAAQRESEARRQIAVLFDENRLETETRRAIDKLSEMQTAEGAWPWFPGGSRNDFISLYIVAGFGRLRQIGVEIGVEPALRAVPGLDAWMTERYGRIKDRDELERRQIDATGALYLYARGAFLKEVPVDPAHRESFEFWVRQAREFWIQLERQSQAHIAVAFGRHGTAFHPDAVGTAEAIARSLKERSVLDPEMGRYWREDERSWWWYRAPIETQSLMIEVFDVVAHDAAAVDECRQWLLQQKRTQDWKTTKATADAVYALLLGGPSLLTSDALVNVEIGGRDVTPRDGPRSERRESRPEGSATTPEPGTGFYEVRFTGSQITPAYADLVVRKSDRGIAWGSVHWQYFEDLDRVKPFEGTPLTLKKALFTRVNTGQGLELRPFTGGAKVGDELVVRLELRVDRDLEFVHLEDQRGSGTEPTNVLSGHRFQDGLGYYESTRDTASHFFVDYLPKGTYVFEYPVRVQHRGEYTSGVAKIQCLYAPEFNSHSAAATLRVE